MIRFLTPLLLALPGILPALTLDMPGNGRMQSESIAPTGSYTIPVGPWVDGDMPVDQAVGRVTRQAWRIDAQGLTTMQILLPLRDQLEQAGFAVVYECDTDFCGGFDFRFATEILGPPDMFVDLGDFRYLAAEHGETGEKLTLIISRSSQAGFVQITSVSPDGAAGLSVGASEPALRGEVVDGRASPDDLGGQLEELGHVILSDLTFEIGSAQLGAGPYASLGDLADYLLANPTRQVALVGHTDSQGSLDGNIALSKRRAGSVLERLVSDYNVPRRQLAAEGMGFLSPRASNLTDEGRDINRRVEVIMVSTE